MIHKKFRIASAVVVLLFLLAGTWWVVQDRLSGDRRTASAADGQRLADHCLADGVFTDVTGRSGLVLKTGEALIVQGATEEGLTVALRSHGCAVTSGFVEDGTGAVTR